MPALFTAEYLAARNAEIARLRAEIDRGSRKPTFDEALDTILPGVATAVRDTQPGWSRENYRLMGPAFEGLAA